VLDQPSEVLAEEAGDECEGQEDGGQDGELLDSGVLLDADLGLLDRDHCHVGLQYRAEQVTLGGDLLVGLEQVIPDVAQIVPQLLVDHALGQGCYREQRVDCAVKVVGLAAQRVDPFGRGSGAGEYGGFDLVDVALEFGHDWRVTVHYLVQDCPQCRCAARGQEIWLFLQSLPGVAQFAGHALPDRDHEGGREENADLAELDFLGGVVVARGAQDDQPHVVFVVLDLRSHVDVQRVLDRQLVQAEGVPHLGKLFFHWLEQPQPHEAALRGLRHRFLQRHHAFDVPAAVLVVSAINDHVWDPLVGCLQLRAGTA
jgi:hypothetical protein